MVKKRTNRKKKFSFREQYRISWRFIKESKNFIYFGVLIFFLSVLIGLIYPKILENELLAMIENLKAQTEGLNLLQLFWFILFNNVRAAFFALIFGVFFAIIPFANALTNGYVVGFVLNHAIANSGILVMWRLLPHGIFELPALFISIGLGIRLGLFFIISKKKDRFFDWLINSLKIFLFVVLPLLIIAAIIESSLILFFG